MHSHSNNPRDPRVKAVYCFNFLSISTCQNPDLRSKLENILECSKLSNITWILGRGNLSFFILAFNLQKSILKCNPPSFLQTKTTALHHRLLLTCMAPASSMPLTCLLTSSKRGGRILNLSLNGSSSVTYIWCFTWLLYPSSLLSKEKTSWYSFSNSQVCSAS